MGEVFKARNLNEMIADIDFLLSALKEYRRIIDEKRRGMTNEDDLIFRQQAINALHEWEQSYTWDDYCSEHTDDKDILPPSAVIKRLPPAQPQPGAGGWKYYLGKCVCMACGAEFDESSPYCPKCGTFNGGEGK